LIELIELCLFRCSGSQAASEPQFIFGQELESRVTVNIRSVILLSVQSTTAVNTGVCECQSELY